ncbi:HD domain-containing protein [Candidatus Woesearchaeota archaeon]|nr:HD domain-containing protein [Candidatus Woesearchaeota archaeon]
MITPTKEECLKILKENDVPDNVIAHSKKVHEVAMKICEMLEHKGVNANRDLAGAAALLHDIAKVKEGDHMLNGAEIVKSLGFPEVGRIISRHGLAHLDEEEFQPKSTEEKIVFYADKRVTNDRLVSLEDRFKYIKERYKSAKIDREFKFTKGIEEELMGSDNLNLD